MHARNSFDRFDMLEIRNHNNVGSNAWLRELAMYNISDIYPEPFLISNTNNRYSKHVFNPTSCLFDQMKEVDISVSSLDY